MNGYPAPEMRIRRKQLRTFAPRNNGAKTRFSGLRMLLA